MMKNKDYPRIVVGVLIYNDKKEVFIAKSHKWHDKWMVPGGKIEYGESLHEAVKREIKEETNLDVDNIKFVQWQEHIFDPNFYKKKHFLFMNFCAKALNNEVIINEEMQEYKWLLPEKTLELDLNEPTREFIEQFIKYKKNFILFDK